jgi:hypothetical protein
MTAVRVGFVGGDSWLDKAIEAASGSQYADISHAFIFLLNSIVEAEGVKQYADPYPGVWLHPPGKYDGDSHVKIIEIDVPDMPAAESKARELIGTLYGYSDCIVTATKFLTGHNIFSGGENTMHCSETVTRILRAGGLPVCPGLQADEVSPVLLYEDLQQRGGVIV